MALLFYIYLLALDIALYMPKNEDVVINKI